MQIRSVTMDTRNLAPKQNISFINTYNKNLLKFQKDIENQPEMAKETRREINEKLRSSIKEIIEYYDKKIEYGIKQTAVVLKSLQLLRIKYSLTAIKCGDTDWETFQISEFLHRDIDDFIKSTHCTLTLDEQTTQRVDSTLRNAVWLSCLYNFSRELVYEKIDAPQNRENKLFYGAFTRLRTTGVPDSLACVIANAQAALTLCRLSFGEERAQRDTLYCDVKEVVEFYDDYLQARQLGKEVDFLMQNAYFKREKTLIPADTKYDIAVSYYEQVTEYL